MNWSPLKSLSLPQCLAQQVQKEVTMTALSLSMELTNYIQVLIE